MKATDWISSVLTAVIAIAAIMQWRVAARLEAIEASREKVRLLLRFVYGGYGASIRIANLSSFGVFIERIECSIFAALPDGVPPLEPGKDKFKSTATWERRNVLPAFGTDVIEVQPKILETIEGRNAEFLCDLEAWAVYVDHGKERTTMRERIKAKVHQQRLMEYLGGR